MKEEGYANCLVRKYFQQSPEGCPHTNLCKDFPDYEDRIKPITCDYLVVYQIYGGKISPISIQWICV